MNLMPSILKYVHTKTLNTLEQNDAYQYYININ